MEIVKHRKWEDEEKEKDRQRNKKSYAERGAILYQNCDESSE